MSRSHATMSAGNASASTFISLNGPLGGGSKKQGLPSTVARISGIDYNRSSAGEQNLIFNINQIGGVGRGKSMFQSNADGVFVQSGLKLGPYKLVKQ